MTTNFSILFFGFLLGMRHATEADHLTAIFTLITQRSALTQGLKLGMAWGLGHTLTLMLLGGTVLMLGKTIPTHFAQLLEAIVGVMLVILGIGVLRRLTKNDVPLSRYFGHSHTVKMQIMNSATTSNVPVAHSKKISEKALLIGMVHGLAGSSALILISLEQASTVTAGLIYILIFGLGSILGMGMLSLAIALPGYITAAKWQNGYLGFSIMAGLISIAMGLNIIYQNGHNLRLIG